jgi:hypothetical protein
VTYLPFLRKGSIPFVPPVVRTQGEE